MLYNVFYYKHVAQRAAHSYELWHTLPDSNKKSSDKICGSGNHAVANNNADLMAIESARQILFSKTGHHTAKILIARTLENQTNNEE